MKNNVNPVAIGMFVLAAAVIAVAAVMIFGAAKFFAKTEMFVSFFSESVNGLDVGAPLKYKGVPIGKVEKIMIGKHSGKIREGSVAVVYSIDIGMLRRKSDTKVVDFDEWLREQIADGLRAKLNYQSIVTGMLYIELDYLGERDDHYTLKYRGPHDHIEIPSKKSGLAELAKAMEKTIRQISEIDFKSIGENANVAVANIAALTGDPHLRNAPRSLDNLLSKSTGLVEHADQIVSSPETKALPHKLNTLLGNADAFAVSAQTELKSLSAAGQQTFSNIDSVLKNVDTIIAPQSPLRYELAVMIRGINDSLNSISNLTDYLERNPSALITGKLKKEKGK